MNFFVFSVDRPINLTNKDEGGMTGSALERRGGQLPASPDFLGVRRLKSWQKFQVI